jgi:hypothetical protein
MMTLPKFTNPDPSLDELLAEEKRLQIQADKMLEQTNLLETLAKYGKLLPISGSYAYGLMVYPDIDLSLISENISKESFANLVTEMVKSKWVRKVSTADTVNFELIHDGWPKGYWLGLEIPFEGDKWGVDCWLQEKDSAPTTPDPYTASLHRMGEEKRNAVLSIKYQLIYMGLYGKSYFSDDIYDAVLNDNILSIEEFLKSKPKNVDG